MIFNAYVEIHERFNVSVQDYTYGAFLMAYGLGLYFIYFR